MRSWENVFLQAYCPSFPLSILLPLVLPSSLAFFNPPSLSVHPLLQTNFPPLWLTNLHQGSCRFVAMKGTHRYGGTQTTRGLWELPLTPYMTKKRWWNGPLCHALHSSELGTGCWGKIVFFYNSLQPLPRLHRCKRPSKLSTQWECTVTPIGW